jgi:uncharacterized membrane protein YphA (DoxX/SURF4 family)
MFIHSGLNKFLNYMPPPKEMAPATLQMFTGMKQITWLIPLIGVAEIVGGILFITNKYRALGALIIFPVMIGILLTHIIVEPSGLAIALVLFAILIWAMVENREKYYPLIR